MEVVRQEIRGIHGLDVTVQLGLRFTCIGEAGQDTFEQEKLDDGNPAPLHRPGCRFDELSVRLLTDIFVSFFVLGPRQSGCLANKMMQEL